MKTLNKDVVILGGGSAGMNAFRAARKHTDSVLLIEDHHFGTTCARVGCMPSKLLIAAAEARHAAMHTDPFGVHISGEITVNGEEVMRRVKSERDRFVGFVMEDVEGFPAECRMLGRAKFIDEHTVQVDDDTQITFKRAVIATGSRSIIIPAWQALGDKLIVNDDVFSWDTLPESVAVFGPGVIGLELGQALHRLGVRVSVFGIGGLIGGITDPVITEKAKAIFSQELDLYLDAKTQVQLTENQQVQVTFEDSDGRSGTATYDYLLAAIGRRPNVDQIGLENLSIELDQRGVPIANPKTMQTSLPHIFIAGDASAQIPLLHEASDQGAIAGRNAGAYPDVQTGLRRSPIGVIFSNPQIMSVGLRWTQVQAAYSDLASSVVVGEVSFNNQGRSRVMLINKGHLRVYAEQKTGRFLGAEMVGPAAEHIAHLLAWAHQNQMTIPQMLDMPFYHPVIEEGVRTALRDVFAQLQLN